MAIIIGDIHGNVDKVEAFLSYKPEAVHFAEECRRQSRLVAQADMADTEMQRFMDKALADVDGWTE